jgi:small subunit ribosomal protein S8
MTLSDPIADMLTRMRNAGIARHEFVLLPASKIKISIAKILKEEGFIKDYEVLKGNTPQRVIKIHFAYAAKRQPQLTELQRVSKPSLRVYCRKGQVPRIFGGLGIAIVSTSQGVMTAQQAWKKGLGGEILCYVW